VTEITNGGAISTHVDKWWIDGIVVYWGWIHVCRLRIRLDVDNWV
jgi:hypothetical protein